MNDAVESFDFEGTLRRALKNVCELSGEQSLALRIHFELLEKWNRRINLTSIRDSREVVERHYCESVFLGHHLPAGEMTVVDVGSGGGFPGIGVAVMRPQAKITLIDSNQKKASFLRESTRHLSNVRVSGCRAEASNKRFSWLISRAVAWEDLPLIGDRVAILASEPGPEFAWQESIRLPWGHRRVLLIGEVPRGTQK